MLKTLAQLNQYSKARPVWVWEEYVFVEDAKEHYWHVRCPKDDRAGSSLLDSEGLVVSLTREDETRHLRIESVHTLRSRVTAVVRAIDVRDTRDRF